MRVDVVGRPAAGEWRWAKAMSVSTFLENAMPELNPD